MKSKVFDPSLVNEAAYSVSVPFIDLQLLISATSAVLPEASRGHCSLVNS